MNLPDGLLDSTWVVVTWLLFVPFALHTLWYAPWRPMANSGRFNTWLGLIVLLVLLWSMKAGVKPGLSLHLLGATVMTLCFGWRLAFVGLCLVLAAVSLNGDAGWESFAANALLMGGLSVIASQAIYRATDRFLPQHFFVYIFANGFFAAGLTVIFVGLASCLLLAGVDAYSLDYLFGEYLPYFMLLGFSEAWLSGMAITLFVVYRPDWVITFGDAHYLTEPKKTPLRRPTHRNRRFK